MTVAHDTAQYIPVMVERIVKAFDPVKIILFGSHARGDARPDSDIDLLVVLPVVDDPARQTIAIYDVLADLPAAKDVVVATPETLDRLGGVAGYVYRPALKEGRTLYVR